MTTGVDAAVPPTLLRRSMLAVTTLTGVAAGVALAVVVVTPCSEAKENQREG